jgi:hypothetical protein
MTSDNVFVTLFLMYSAANTSITRSVPARLWRVFPSIKGKVGVLESLTHMVSSGARAP